MSKVILVTGTSGTKQERGWHIDGPFVNALIVKHVRRLDSITPFYWSSNLDGVFGDNYDWKAAGHALRDYVYARTTRQLRRIAPVHAIGHSHALAVLAYAAEFGLQFGCVVSIGSPFRDKMAPQYRALRQNSRVWIHIHGNYRDVWAWYGSIRPGRIWGNTRVNKYASKNYQVTGVSHSNLVDIRYLEDSGAMSELSN